MGWIILIVVVVLVLGGFASIFGATPETDRSDPDRRARDSDDEMLEDWYTSQELDNDLDDWDR
jgi:uncharacterized protein YceK